MGAIFMLTGCVPLSRLPRLNATLLIHPVFRRGAGRSRVAGIWPRDLPARHAGLVCRNDFPRGYGGLRGASGRASALSVGVALAFTWPGYTFRFIFNFLFSFFFSFFEQTRRYRTGKKSEVVISPSSAVVGSREREQKVWCAFPVGPRVYSFIYFTFFSIFQWVCNCSVRERGQWGVSLCRLF